MMWKRRRMILRKRIIEKGEEMEGKRRDEEDMQDSLALEEGMTLKFPLVYFATFTAPASRFFPARRS